MTQGKLFQRPKRQPTLSQLRAKYAEGKLEAARIILADPERYPGLMQMCARDVVEQWEREREQAERESLL